MPSWGRDQRAKDGGIPVRFNSTALAENSSYLRSPIKLLTTTTNFNGRDASYRQCAAILALPR
jgi:hypothetical protein